MIDDLAVDAPPQSHRLMLSAHWADRPLWVEQTTRMEVQVSPAARVALRQADLLVATVLKRHFTGDWGLVDPAVAARNEGACQTGRSVTSIHRIAGETVVVKTFPGHTMTRITVDEEAT
jgi:hypothetical protein